MSYDVLSKTLLSRFIEPDENLKSDIFHVYIALIRITHPNDDSTNPPDAMDIIKLLQKQIPSIVLKLKTLLTQKSIKTRSNCFLLLCELLNALPNDTLSSHFYELMPGIQYSLNGENSTANMKINALNFLSRMLTTHHPEVFHPHISTLVPLIVESVSNPLYKIATEALLVLQHLVKAIRPLSRFHLNFILFNKLKKECKIN